MPVRWRVLDDWTGLELGLRHAATAAEDQRIFRLPWRYFPGSGDLVVHVNGVLQLPGVDYEETGDQTVSFLWALRSGDRVTFFRRFWIGGSPPTSGTAGGWAYHHITVSEPTSVIHLPPGQRFRSGAPGELRAEVYVNGQLQVEGVSYTVLLDSEGFGVGFQFTSPLTTGDEVYARWVPG